MSLMWLTPKGQWTNILQRYSWVERYGKIKYLCHKKQIWSCSKVYEELSIGCMWRKISERNVIIVLGRAHQSEQTCRYCSYSPRIQELRSYTVCHFILTASSYIVGYIEVTFLIIHKYHIFNRTWIIWALIFHCFSIYLTYFVIYTLLSVLSSKFIEAHNFFLR